MHKLGKQSQRHVADVADDENKERKQSLKSKDFPTQHALHKLIWQIVHLPPMQDLDVYVLEVCTYSNCSRYVHVYFVIFDLG